jgi:hypothetical protein
MSQRRRRQKKKGQGWANLSVVGEQIPTYCMQQGQVSDRGEEKI